MARQEDEAIERLLTATLRSSTVRGEVCPSAEDVAAYLERTLDAEEMRRIELHLSSCARCAETLALLVESEPAAAAAPSVSAWWSWSTWRWVVPAAAVLVIGVWFASTLQDGREPASQMAQYKEGEAPKNEAGERATESSAESAAQSTSPPATETQSRRTAIGAAGAPLVPPESTRANQESADLRREAEKARVASEADSAAARPSTPAQPSDNQPRTLAKAEESRTDAALDDAVKESANAGFAPPATAAAAPAASAAASPAAAPAGPPTAPPTVAAAQPPAAPAGGRAARAAADAAAPTAAQRQEAAEAAPQAARTVAGFAPLVLRTRSGSALWRIAGPVIERSTDGGTTWTTEFRAPRTVSTGVVADDDTVWLVGASGLVLRRPANGGWQIVPPPVMDDLTGTSEPASTSVTVSTADGRRFRTTNNGATWMAR